jgi:hypothetical protein
MVTAKVDGDLLMAVDLSTMRKRKSDRLLSMIGCSLST